MYVCRSDSGVCEVMLLSYTFPFLNTFYKICSLPLACYFEKKIDVQGALYGQEEIIV
jgi:hypothetical protein